MLQRNLFRQPIENEWRIIFCQPKANSARSCNILFVQFGGIFKVKTLFQKLWFLLYKRAELDLRSTNAIWPSGLGAPT